MGKVLFWVVVVIVVLTAMRVIASRSSARKQSQAAAPRYKPGPGRKANDRDAQARAARASTPAGSEPMVRCAHCHIHLPRSDALLIDGRTWCSQGHALLGVRD